MWGVAPRRPRSPVGRPSLRSHSLIRRALGGEPSEREPGRRGARAGAGGVSCKPVSVVCVVIVFQAPDELSQACPRALVPDRRSTAHTHTLVAPHLARAPRPARPDLDKCTSTHTAHRGFSKTPRPLTQAQANHAHGLGKVAPSGDRVHRAPRPYGESDDPAPERSAPRSRRRPCPSECTRRTCP